ncbi:MAG: alpha/beta hydrolase [Campylobacterota bacterium]|nr:alpha/beta hydrolase [Campylobacterota bacterium]
MVNIEDHYIQTNGVHLHVLQAGPIEGPLLILLHGFPEFSYAWRDYIPYLASAGFRVWVPDQRGYNLSDKPKGIASYTLDALAKDVLGLIDAAKHKQAFLVGHDWGGSVAWHIATKYPERIIKMIVLNVPHLGVLKKNLLSNAAQLRKSNYLFLLQVPWIPEIYIKFKQYMLLKKKFRISSRPGTFTDDDLETYYRSWIQPKAFHSMLNWYRAAMQRPIRYRKTPHLTQPTLVIWGKKDKFLCSEMAQQSIDLCSEGHLIFFEEATHWIIHEEVSAIQKLIVSFFKESSIS